MPAISSVAVATQMAANMVGRFDRRMHQREERPQRSSEQVEAVAEQRQDGEAGDRPQRGDRENRVRERFRRARTSGKAPAVIPNTYTSAWPGGT